MCFVAKNIVAKPLDRMEQHQSQSKADEVENGKGISQEFSHMVKIKNCHILS